MTTLPELLNFVVTTLQVYPACTHVQVMETCIFATDQFFCKIRADFGKTLSFQARIYYNQGHYDYAYQVFSAGPLLRWDNKEDAPGLPNFPHHHHTAAGDIVTSALQGIPKVDLPIILQEIERYIP